MIHIMYIRYYKAAHLSVVTTEISPDCSTIQIVLVTVAKGVMWVCYQHYLHYWFYSMRQLYRCSNCPIKTITALAVIRPEKPGIMRQYYSCRRPSDRASTAIMLTPRPIQIIQNGCIPRNLLYD